MMLIRIIIKYFNIKFLCGKGFFDVCLFVLVLLFYGLKV